MKYKCNVCGEYHEHKKFLFGSPVDYECKKIKEKQIINSIKSELLDIASLYNECSTSDLQGIATAKAYIIYNLLKKELKK